MKKVLLIAFVLSLAVYSQKTANDGEWNKQSITLKNTTEAAVMIRVGDIDNLGFGWSEGFNPFSGKSTEAHRYPWEMDPSNHRGTDKIMLPSSLKDLYATPCGNDGYSQSLSDLTKPEAIVLPLTDLKGVEIKAATLLLFVDDFQAPEFCTKYRVWFNGVRFSALERILNKINQTGPIGKIIYQEIPSDLLPLLQKEKLVISIDDSTTKAGDGYAVDFVKLLVNPKPYQYKGPVTLKITNEEGEPMKGCAVQIPGYPLAYADAEGVVTFKDLPAGMVLAEFTMEGYLTEAAGIDILSEYDEIPFKEITLRKATTVTSTYDGRILKEGDTLNLANVQFASGSSELTAKSKSELDKMVLFLSQNPKIDIELSGHTSSDGNYESNKSLSLSRVESCKQYLISKEISPDRITTVGYGPDRPVAPNDTEKNRAKNRRVEMRILKIR